MTNEIKEDKQLFMGIELGSTRIKAILIDKYANVVSQGDYEWENSFENNYWTYSLEDVKVGLRTAYKNLKDDYFKKYNSKLTKIDSLGISAMMHGFLVFDKSMHLLTPFRTWRNTNTDKSSSYLTELFKYNIPHRWSVAHLYQAILNKEEYVKDIDFMTTLSGYVHFLLTGQKVLGIGDASGMFPIDSNYKDYNKHFIDKFDSILGVKELNLEIEEILPKVLLAGDFAGKLTAHGAKLLDPSGDLKPGVSMCPPEGDAGTGMVATNSIKIKTGNISIGTSIFSMIVLEKELKKYYREIDIVSTPNGNPVAMVHCNNGTSDFDAWVTLFKDFSRGFNCKINSGDIYEFLYNKALNSDLDAGGIMVYNYLSGEPINGILEGRPLVIRKEDSKMNISNFTLANLYSIMSTIRIGQDILTEKENVIIDQMLAHGGVFKTKDVMQKIVAASLDTNIGIYKTASEGGAWGIALLGLYSKNKAEYLDLPEFLNKIFERGNSIHVESPDKNIKNGFEKYLNIYKKLLGVQDYISDLY